MKSYLLILTLFCTTCSLFGQGHMITEIGYDNNYFQLDPFGIDSIEYVEIYLHSPQPTDLTSFQIVTYNNAPLGSATAEVGFVRDLTDAIAIGNTPDGVYYVIEFADSTAYGFPSGGMRDGADGVALVEVGSPNIVHQFWRYESCDDFTAIDGPAIGAVSDPITTDYSRACGSSGVFLVKMTSATPTTHSIYHNGFGDWELGLSTSNLPTFENNGQVPVNLLFFNAIAKDENVRLTWATAQEKSNEYFSILHATDGRSFNEIGTVLGSGDSNGESKYEFRTEKMSTGRHYFKLKQVDFDGTYEEFKIRSVKIDGEDKIELFPSLVTSEITLRNVETGTSFQLFDIQGQLIKEGTYNSTINASHLKSGTYILKVNDAALRFVKF